MRRRRESWVDILRSLGQAFFEVVRAEMAVLAAEWKRSGRELAVALGVFAVAAVLVVLLLPLLLVFAAVAGVQAASGWPWWGAALTVALAVVVAAALLAAIGRYVLVRRFESPWHSAKQRIGDHVAWWNERVLGPPVPSLKEGRSDGRDADKAFGDEADADEIYP